MTVQKKVFVVSGLSTSVSMHSGDDFPSFAGFVVENKFCSGYLACLSSVPVDMGRFWNLQWQ